MRRLWKRLLRTEPGRTRHTGRTRTFRPFVEALETRWCPSVTIVRDPVMWTRVLVTGDDMANKVAIRQDDAADRIWIAGDGTNFDAPSRTVAEIVIDLKEEHDVVTYNLDSDLTSSKVLRVTLGSGDDTAVISAADPDLRDVYRTVRSGLNVSVAGDRGADRLQTEFGAVGSGNVSITAKLGAGDDHLDAYWFGDLTGRARVAYDVDGEAGKDQLYFWATNDLVKKDDSGIDISADAALQLTLRGGTEDDHIETQYQGILHGGLTFSALGSANNDTTDTRFTLNGGSDGSANVLVQGDDGDDVVRVNVWDNSGGAAAVSALADGGAGWDAYNVASNVPHVNFDILFGWIVVLP